MLIEKIQQQKQYFEDKINLLNNEKLHKNLQFTMQRQQNAIVLLSEFIKLSATRADENQQVKQNRLHLLIN